MPLSLHPSLLRRHLEISRDIIGKISLPEKTRYSKLRFSVLSIHSQDHMVDGNKTNEFIIGLSGFNTLNTNEDVVALEPFVLGLNQKVRQGETIATPNVHIDFDISDKNEDEFRYMVNVMLIEDDPGSEMADGSEVIELVEDAAERMKDEIEEGFQAGEYQPSGEDIAATTFEYIMRAAGILQKDDYIGSQVAESQRFNNNSDAFGRNRTVERGANPLVYRGEFGVASRSKKRYHFNVEYQWELIEE